MPALRENRGDQEIDQRFSKRSKEARELAGITREDAAEKLGLNKSHLYKIEKGRGRATAGIVHRMSELYRVPHSFFFDDAGEEEEQPFGGAIVVTDSAAARRRVEVMRDFAVMPDDLQRIFARTLREIAERERRP
jgi:transcriptional regulator with XRE-family HTH domain